jgi:hypothetical protein
MVGFSEQADDAGWTLGIDAMESAGFLIVAADSAFGAGKTMMEQIHNLARELVEEAGEKLGRDVITSKDPVKLERLQRFLKTSPKYYQLRQSLSRLPKSLTTGLARHLAPTSNVSSGDARWLRRQFVLPEVAEPGHYFNSVASSLEGKVSRLGRFGTGTTFVLPAAIGLYNVYRAAPSERFTVGLEEAVGIGLGAFGAEAGLAIGGAVAAVLGLTGIGLFILLFVTAGVAAYEASEGGKMGVRTINRFFE